VPSFLKLLRDGEAEVRVAAAGKVAAFCKLLGSDTVRPGSPDSATPPALDLPMRVNPGAQVQLQSIAGWSQIRSGHLQVVLRARGPCPRKLHCFAERSAGHCAQASARACADAGGRRPEVSD